MAFKEYPPRQNTASFAVDQALEMLQKGAGGHSFTLNEILSIDSSGSIRHAGCCPR
jgi:hypothetical protein